MDRKPRDVITATEVLCELFDTPTNKITPYMTRDIHNLLSLIETFERQGSSQIKTAHYGRQKYYKRKEVKSDLLG